MWSSLIAYAAAGGEKDTTTSGNPRICPIGLPMEGYLLGCFRIIEHPFDR